MRKRYHAPSTPCDRLLTDLPASEEVRPRVEALRVDLDLVRFPAEVRSGQQALGALAERATALLVGIPVAPILVVDFLAGLRTAWRMGEIQPTA